MQTAREVVPVEGVVEDIVPVQQTAPRSQAMVTTPPAMLALAIEKGAGMETLERLMTLQERWEANEARKAYVAAMAAFKAEPISIAKSKAVGYETQGGDFVGYKHATIADVVDAVVPAMAKHGLSHAWDVKQANGQITVACTITHELGHREAVEMTAAPDNSGKKNAIQQVASTITYLQRYTLLAATGTASKEMDDDGRSFEASKEDVEPEYADWKAAIAGESTQDGLKGVKRELEKKFGNAIPKVLVDLCVTRMAEIKAGAK